MEMRPPRPPPPPRGSYPVRGELFRRSQERDIREDDGSPPETPKKSRPKAGARKRTVCCNKVRMANSKQDTLEQVPEQESSGGGPAASTPQRSAGGQHQGLPPAILSDGSHLAADPRGGWGPPPSGASDTSRGSRRPGRRAASEPSRGAGASQRRGPRRDHPRADREDYYGRDRGDRSTFPEAESSGDNSSPGQGKNFAKKSRGKAARKSASNLFDTIVPRPCHDTGRGTAFFGGRSSSHSEIPKFFMDFSRFLFA